MGTSEFAVSVLRRLAESPHRPHLVVTRPDKPRGRGRKTLPPPAEVGGELLVETLDTEPECRPQPDQGVTIAPKIENEDRRLDPSAGAAALVRRVRALNPHVGTWIELPGGERLGVRRAAIAPLSAAPGQLVEEDGRLLWGCAGGALELLVVQPAGGRPMDAADFLRGHRAKLTRGG